MAIGELLDALTREADAEVAALDAAARADAERLRAEAAERRRVRRGDVLAAVRARARVTHDTAVAQAARDCRGAVLAARAAALDRVLAAATARLPDLLAGPAGAAIEARLAASVAAVGGEQVRRTPTGLVAERDGGRVTIDATLPTLLERWWPRLRVEVRPDGGAP